MTTDRRTSEEILRDLEAARREVSNRHIWNNAMTRGARPRPPDTSELDAKIAAAKKACGKLFWQRTQRQMAVSMGMPADRHRKYVTDAVAAGEDIPASVRADYPDLFPPTNNTTK